MAKPEYWQADQYMKSGNFQAALGKYEEIITLYPKAADEACFGIGSINLNQRNPERNNKKAYDSFKKLTEDYPMSKYKESSVAILGLLDEMARRDRGSSALRKQVETLEKQNESLQKQIDQMKEIDRTLEEKRRTVPQRK